MPRDFDVVIIGGGFSGLSLSLFLKRKGLRSVVLEKSERVGGKARTLYLESNTLELGTCYLARDYWQVAALAKQFNLDERALGSVSAHPESLLDEFYNRTLFGYVTELGPLLVTLRRYAARRRLALSRFEARIEEEYAGLAMPARDWLTQQRCERLVPIFNGLLDIYGYGPVNTIAALYALRWMTPDLILTAFLKGSRLIAQGFAEFARRMADEAQILTSTALIGSRRADGDWLLSTSNGSLRARYVVIACPPNSAELHALFDRPRREILERDVVSTHYVSVALAAKNWFMTHRRAFLKGDDHRDHLIAARCDGRGLDGRRYFICYLYPTVDDNDHIESILRRDIAADGGELLQILEFGHWRDYMTRIKNEAIAAGRYFVLEDRQGVDNVWLCNSIVAHENWRDLLALSHRMADEIAAGPAEARQ